VDLCSKATEKKVPSYVFIDTNLPPPPDELEFERWLRELDKTMNDLSAKGYSSPRETIRGQAGRFR
jgi:hypothetical protein